MPRSHQRHLGPPSRTSAPTATRTHFLIEWLRSGRPLTTTLAADALGVSRRTIARDLARIRKTSGFAVRYDPSQGSYTIDAQHAAIPFIPHPDLLPSILNGTLRTETDGALPPNAVHIQFSARSVQAYEAASGLDLSHAADEQGRLEIYFEVSDPDVFVRWVLSSGGEAEVLAPESVRNRVVVEIRRMLAVYDDEGRGAP